MTHNIIPYHNIITYVWNFLKLGASMQLKIVSIALL